MLGGQKPWALLAYLLLNPAGATRRDFAERLWPEAEDPLAAARWAILQVRRALEPEATLAEADGRLVVRVAPEAPAIAVDAVTLLDGRFEPATVDWLVGGDLLEGMPSLLLCDRSRRKPHHRGRSGAGGSLAEAAVWSWRQSCTQLHVLVIGFGQGSTSPLPATCCSSRGWKKWSGRRGSNPRHSAWEADTLPTELLPLGRPRGSPRAPRNVPLGRRRGGVGRLSQRSLAG